MTHTLYFAGAYENITPHGKSVLLAGQYYERLTNRVESDLFVTAAVFVTEQIRVVWITCDLVCVTNELVEQTRKLITQKEPGLSSATLIANATHTHTAPGIRQKGQTKNNDSVLSESCYRTFVAEKMASAAITAYRNCDSSCAVYGAWSPIETGHCRRGLLKNGDAVMYIDVTRPDFEKMEAPDGGPMRLAFVKNEHDIPVAVLANIPCPAQVLEHQSYISSDYIGRVRKLLQKHYGHHFIFLPLIGAAGDQSPRDLLHRNIGYADMYDKSGADDLAARVFDAIVAKEKHPFCQGNALSVTSDTITLDGRLPSEHEYQKALTLSKSSKIRYCIADYEQKGIEPYYKTPLALAKQTQTVIERYEHRAQHETLRVPIHAVRLGPAVLITNPFELFSGYGARIIAGATAPFVWPVQLTCESLGYFPTKQATAAGGYGANIQSCRVDAAKSGDSFVENSIRLADSVT